VKGRKIHALVDNEAARRERCSSRRDTWPMRRLFPRWPDRSPTASSFPMRQTTPQ
jgi:hypothetical protein